ncbi:MULTISPECIES: DUF1788 domain-containing protein [unclassified Pseudomonas]|uniref:DUF1788 domain-containing protein n=1 Tax=unclassified Pseudomonas TaxID=196821 RepID=UPI000C8826BD|nr:MULTISPECIES: DUF1788 domain-containing protein [unclassified Pseudomonas]PMZ92914.1 DUF1788 domain-containing protein [Pseudomonas sp. FW305-42]PNA20770.1 DUF1788 domain-containing protein [Pseudomonas sp. MPR-R1B]PNB23547.1 DUF1788 domain-containing protein [Pseudomonas sp. DP16D-E2]PNB41326.1 DUF1788 domain-containing protein [Pseudomonas sp. FW305-17]PNB59465.1 DUF1788 domain-containing protein [Pseudomonas sp. GW531-E2]
MPVNDLDERLNRILEKVTSDDFLGGQGLGNEVPFYAFDYLPQDEERVREHARFLQGAIIKRRPELRVAFINLFELMIDMLKSRSKLDQSIEMQAKKGDDYLLKALKAPLDAGKVARELVDRYPPSEFDLLVINGVGSAYPLIRTHNLLNNLQPFMGQTPLVVFYPGLYDGQSLKLFGQLGEKPYYRAFRLVS